MPELKLGWCAINTGNLIKIHKSQGHERPTFQLPPSLLLNSPTLTLNLQGEKEFVYNGQTDAALRKLLLGICQYIPLSKSFCILLITDWFCSRLYMKPPSQTHTHSSIFCNSKLSTLLLNEWCWWEMTPAFLNTQQSNLNLCANYWPLWSTLLWNNQATIGLESVAGRPQGKANTGVTAGLFL